MIAGPDTVAPGASPLRQCTSAGTNPVPENHTSRGRTPDGTAWIRRRAAEARDMVQLYLVLPRDVAGVDVGVIVKRGDPHCHPIPAPADRAPCCA